MRVSFKISMFVLSMLCGVALLGSYIPLTEKKQRRTERPERFKKLLIVDPNGSVNDNIRALKAAQTDRKQELVSPTIRDANSSSSDEEGPVNIHSANQAEFSDDEGGDARFVDPKMMREMAQSISFRYCVGFGFVVWGCTSYVNY